MGAWDPEQYERYAAYRDRPALDLLVQLPPDLEPREVWDLGCGTGEHAALLARRWPHARVRGLDSSREMLAKARVRPEPVEWVDGDVASWRPDAPASLVFSNSALHWAPDHQVLLPALIAHLAGGGVFACQMPVTQGVPWREAVLELVRSARWRDRLAHVAAVQRVEMPERYYDLLSPLVSSVDIWSTTYLQALTGDDPVLEWLAGAGLTTYLAALTERDERRAFRADVGARMADLFPRRADGVTLFPFPRLFILARR